MDELPARNSGLFRLHAVTVRPERNLLCGAGIDVAVEPKVMDVLCAFLDASGDVVSRSDLIARVWTGGAASDESLTRAIFQLRKALHRIDPGREYVETVAKRGYRVTVDAVRGVASLASPAEAPQVDRRRYAIAVLTFSDLSEGRDQAHLAEGIAAEITGALVRLPSLRVVGRSSLPAAKAPGDSGADLARMLGVTHLLEGSVRKHGDRLRVSAQLVEAASGVTVWSETFEDESKDIFDLEEKIAVAVGANLKALLEDGAIQPRLAERLTANQEAYDLFLRGRSLSKQIFGDGVLQKGAACLERAVELDPGFAEAWAELSNCYGEMAAYTPQSDPVGVMSRCERAAERAIDLKPDCGLAYAMLALCALSDNRPADAIRLALVGVQREPENPDALLRAGYCLMVIGRTRDALPYLQKAVALDPMHGRNHFVLAMTYLNHGDLEEFETHAQAAIDVRYHAAIYIYGQAAYARGDHELAVERVSTLATTFDFFTSSFWPEYVTPELWKMSALGWFSGQAEHRELLFRGISMVAQNSTKKDDLTLGINYALLGKAPELFRYYSPRPGANITLTSLWHRLEPSCQIREHADFPAFAERIGLKAAWDIVRPAGYLGRQLVMVRSAGASGRALLAAI